MSFACAHLIFASADHDARILSSSTTIMSGKVGTDSRSTEQGPAFDAGLVVETGPTTLLSAGTLARKLETRQQPWEVVDTFMDKVKKIPYTPDTLWTNSRASPDPGRTRCR